VYILDPEYNAKLSGITLGLEDDDKFRGCVNYKTIINNKKIENDCRN